MTPLHILCINYHAPPDAIIGLLMSNMEAAFHQDYHRQMALDYAWNYNVRGLLSMINVLCNHRSAQQQFIHRKKGQEIIKYEIVTG